MKTPQILMVGAGATATCVALFWCMNISLLPWLGVYLTQGSPYVGGIGLFGGLMFVLTWFYGKVLLKNDNAKKFPGVLMGIAYGGALAAIFIWVIPPVLAALTGNPAVHQSVGDIGNLGAGIGHRIFPAPPDLGFRPPLASLGEKPWWNVNDWQGRVVPFGITFLATGLFIGLFGAGKGKSGD